MPPALTHRVLLVALGVLLLAAAAPAQGPVPCAPEQQCADCNRGSDCEAASQCEAGDDALLLQTRRGSAPERLIRPAKEQSAAVVVEVPPPGNATLDRRALPYLATAAASANHTGKKAWSLAVDIFAALMAASQRGSVAAFGRGAAARGAAARNDSTASLAVANGSEALREVVLDVKPAARHVVPPPPQHTDGWNTAIAFVGLGLLGVGLQVMMAECLLLDHGGLCTTMLIPLAWLRLAAGRLRKALARLRGLLARRGELCRLWARGFFGGSAQAERHVDRCLLKQLPPGMLNEVSAWLPAADLFRLGATSRALVHLPDEVCSYQHLLYEVRRLDLEHEWVRYLDVGSPADEAPPQEQAPTKVPAVMLRRFLTSHSLRLILEEQQTIAARRLQACCDLFRFVLLTVCWATFLCEVVQLAEAGSKHNALMVIKALISPFVFLYVLENSELNLGRSALVTCISLALLYDCAQNHHLTVIFHSLASREASASFGDAQSMERN
mmetsp:Transcript_60366/g.155573  ORF Transcript_60366/g.155573 Transcript_60366/m.155573 type:complete len:499 (-) Transcript_60366:78-1574(-)